MTDGAATTTTQVHRVYIRATAQEIWDTITSPEMTARFGYGGHAHYDLRPGGALIINPDAAMRAGAAAMGWPLEDVIIDGEVLVADAPTRLSTTWRMLMDEGTAAEGFSTLTYDITQYDGFCGVVVTHELPGMPKLAAMVAGAEGAPGQGGGGHPWALSDLKSLIETGARMADDAT